MDDSGQIIYKVLSGTDVAENRTDTSNNEKDEPDLSWLCRICGNTNEYLIPIFEGEGQENNLAEKIHSYLPIKVNALDNYPDHVCYQCASTLLAFHDLVDCCVQANDTLTSRIQRGHTKKKKKPDQARTSANQERLLRGRCPDITERSAKGNNLAPTKSQTESCTNRFKANLLQQNQETITHICSFCSQPFMDSDALTTHLLDSHADLLFHCDVCGSYLDRKELISHMSKHAEQYALSSKSDVQTPRPNTTSTENTIDQPNLSKTEEIKKDSIQRHNKDDDAFSTSSHSDRFDPIPDSVFEAIKDPDEIDIDLPSGTKEEASKIQDETLTQNADKPQEKEKVKNEPNRIICPICSKEFRLPSSYHYHKKHYHGGVKEHSCNVCGRNFAVKSALTAHLTLHTGTKPYSCPQCSKEFRSKASVYIHYKNVHCESKRFTCTTCNRSFRWKQKLLRHIASHTKEKKYFCTQCNKGFGVKYDLTRHMKSHVDSKPHVCDKCDSAFSQLRYLKSHVEKKHSASQVKVKN